MQVLGGLADEYLERIIRRVLEEARARGRDELTQGRPDMTASEALAAVELARRFYPGIRSFFETIHRQACHPRVGFRSPRRAPATMPQNDRKKVFDAAKLAVNAFAKDPSDGNAARVQAAWGAVKDMQIAPFWQQQLGTWLRSVPGPEDDLKHVIQQALEDARNRGRDYVGQTELAVRAVRQVRPDMNASDALASVRLFRQS